MRDADTNRQIDANHCHLWTLLKDPGRLEEAGAFARGLKGSFQCWADTAFQDAVANLPDEAHLERVVDTLLDAQPDWVRAGQGSGTSVLQVAVGRGHAGVVERLLARGAGPFSRRKAHPYAEGGDCSWQSLLSMPPDHPGGRPWWRCSWTAPN